MPKDILPFCKRACKAGARRTRYSNTRLSFEGRLIFPDSRRRLGLSTVNSSHRNSYPTLRRIVSRSFTSTSHERHMSNRNDYGSEFRTKVTNLLLASTSDEYPPGSLTADLIQEAEEALDSWSSEHSAAGFENATKLLKRLVQEQEYLDQHYSRDFHLHEDDFYLVRPYLVNRVVDCWRICWGKNRSINISPTEMLNELDDLELRGVVPDNRALTMIVDGMMLRGDALEAPLLAQWVLDRRMEQCEHDPKKRPDSFLLTNVIRAWAKSGRLEGPEMAEGILDLMHDLYESGWFQSGPNAVSYAVTMEAWSKSRHPDSAKSIERLLERMKASTIEDVAPDRLVYSYVLRELVYSKMSGPEKAYKYLQEMINLYEIGNQKVAPEISDFSRVLFALARVGDTKRAESLFKQLQNLHHETSDPRFQHDNECNKAMMIVMAKKGAVKEAESMLDELILAANGNSSMPKRSYFIDLLVAWTKDKNRITAAKRSEKLLRRMVDLAQAGHPNLMPDSQSFGKVLLAWSKTKTPDAGAKADTLLKILLRLHRESNDPSLQPTARVLEIVVLIWSRSTHPKATERAAELVHEMETRYAEGENDMRPSRGVYTNLMQAYVRRRSSSEKNRIQEIFDKMNILYSQGHKEYQPDLMVYSVLMDFWAQHGEATKVQAIFEQMLDEYMRGNRAAKPDSRAFNAIIKAWSFSKNPNRAQRAEVVFKKMEEFGRSAGVDLRPDAHTFSQMILVWAGSGTADAAEKAETYLRLSLEKGHQATFLSYRATLDAWLRNQDSGSIERAASLLEELLEAVQSKRVRPPFPEPYRKFLQSIGNSAIPGRSVQAQRLLGTLPKEKVHPLIVC